MLEIDPRTYAALQADWERRYFVGFVAWWRASSLPETSPDRLRTLWDRACVEAARLGVGDDEDARISLYAAAMALIPYPDERQFLLVADALFEPVSRDERLAAIAAIARGTP